VHLIRFFGITATAGLLAACSGGGASTVASHTAPVSPIVTPNANGKTTATIHIHLAAASSIGRKAKSAKRKPLFVDVSDSNGVIITDVTSSGPQPPQVNADVRTGSPLSPLCTPVIGGGFDCSIVAPSVPDVTNTYTVTLLDAQADCTPGVTPGCTYSLQKEGVSPNAPGYGSGFVPSNISTTVVLSMGQGSGITPTQGTNTTVSIVLDPVVANLADDSIGLPPQLQVPPGTPGLLANPSAFVDNGGVDSIYVVVQDLIMPKPTSDTFGPLPEDADQASVVNPSLGGGSPSTQFFVGPTDKPFPLNVAVAPVVAGTTTGVTLAGGSPNFNVASPTQFGPLPVAFTYDGLSTSTSPAQITISETTPPLGSAMSGGTDQFGNNYNESPPVTYVVAPYSLSSQTITGLGTSGTATITASVFGATAFTVTPAGSCAPAGGTALANFASPGSVTTSAGNNTEAFTVTPTAAGIAGAGTATCTFTIVASFTPSTAPTVPVAVTSAPITVTF
jgi:hypothetical protein